MNLAFNFHDKLFWIHNFLPESLYKKMYANIIKTRNELNFHKTSVEWRIFKEEEDDMSMSYGQDKFDNEVINFLFKYHTLLKTSTIRKFN